LDLQPRLGDGWSVAVAVAVAVAAAIPIAVGRVKRIRAVAKPRIPAAPGEGRIEEVGVVESSADYHDRADRADAHAPPLGQRLRRPKARDGEAETGGDYKAFGNHDETSGGRHINTDKQRQCP